MNILPHKSWHVRTKKNIEKVRRDEEKAALEEKEKQRRQALADQEARTDLLRLRASGKSGKHDKISSDVTKDVVVYESDGKREHINFFKDIEDGLKHGKNREHEAEKKQEQEEFEKKIGLLTYLGQSTKEVEPWYLKNISKSSKESESSSQKNVSKPETSHSMDPLMQMSEYLKKKHKSSENKKEQEKVDKNKSKHTVKTPQSTSHSSSASHPSTSKSMNQLREERLKREREEKARIAALLGKRKSGEEVIKEYDEREDRGRRVKRQYNAQYNPDFFKR
ncbi:leukocyte receptor cluster member 1 [Biomphalaria pfeifferi]|uniref:Leukocyte receptor cluster member 1 n=1 Tax=Biomphalaria pfeifferi TaxID=112525 RepID=A0AAD8BGV4_BIOPF|nr:leukocyte receptor cluster member 1 [Biomphalaria pfeifferi]